MTSPRLPFPVRWPRATIIAGLLAVTAMSVFIAFAPGLKLNPSFKMIIRSDPDIEPDARTKEIFGEDEYVIVAIEHPTNVFDVATLAYIDRLTRAMREVPGVRDTYSLTDIDNIRGEGGMVHTDDLITTLPTTPEEVARIEREAFENPLLVNTVVSADKKAASINVELHASHTTPEGEAELAPAIYAIVDQFEGWKPAGVKTHVTGFPIVSYRSGIYMMQDMAVFGAGSFLLITVIMWLVFRRWQAVLFTTVVVSIAVTTPYGVAALCGVKVTMLLSAVMAFMTALGMQYSMYLGFAYRNLVWEQHLRGGPVDHVAAVAEALAEIRGTVMLSALTCTIGFLSLLTSKVPEMQQFGLFLAIGDVAAAVAVLTIVPAVIAWKPFVAPEQRELRALQSILDRVAAVGVRRPYALLTIVAIAFAGGLAVLPTLETGTDGMQYFRKDSDIYQSESFVRRNMAGTTYLQALVAGPEVDTFKDPAALKKLDAIAKYAETLPHVTKAFSHAEHLKLINRALRGGGAEALQVPDTRQAVEQYLLLHNEPDDFRLLIDSDYKNANVMLRMDTMLSTELISVEGQLEAFMKKTFPGHEVNVVGTTLLGHRTGNKIAESVTSSLGVATLLIWIVMVIGLRSFRLGTLSLIPNLCPSVLIYAFLALIGHRLDPPTALTGAVALGISIDDTLHFFRTWMSRLRSGSDASAAVTETMAHIGKPMVLSHLVLVTGFSILLFSRYLVLFWMGLMMATVAFNAIFWDLACTPAILRILGGRRSQKKAGHKIGSLGGGGA
jgi:uncharacterized protein